MHILATNIKALLVLPLSLSLSPRIIKQLDHLARAWLIFLEGGKIKVAQDLQVAQSRGGARDANSSEVFPIRPKGSRKRPIDKDVTARSLLEVRRVRERFITGCKFENPYTIRCV